ncbi:DUF6612 family protein [Pseudalkalibacillus caeni]|uniref:Lipoprotein n=1 Tax=Exobacillus caeni TaxID=2574798 RepID=A0A5R9FAD8_9BACL|nr:DUF6612 family protein [Pseudalkalibacillus caeni]TLS37524.1 hypothetical protein FCL54_10305 [Pseudalkalibacillus caeni]
MKKIRLTIMALLLAGILAACGTVNVEQGIDAAEVFKNAEEASKELNSFAMSGSIEQTMEAPDGEKMILDTQLEGKVIVDPMAGMQKMKMDIMGKTEEMITYFNDEGFYMKEPQTSKWIKLPEKMMAQFGGMDKKQSNPANQLEELKNYVDDFSLEEKDGEYLLHLTASGDKFKQLIKETIAEMGTGAEMPEEILSKMNVQNLSYDFVVDKESYFPKEMKMVMEMLLTAEGKTGNIAVEMSMDYSDYNEIKEINIPEEALNAAEMPLSGLPN